MDPNANLQWQLEEVDGINEIIDAADDDGNLDDDQKNELVDRAQRLAELVESLHGWIAGGGFLPREWSRGR